VRQGWQIRPLADLVENLNSKRAPVKESDRKPGPYPYYGASGIVDYVDAFLFEGLHLLVAEDGENLRTRKLPVAFLANGRFWVNNHAHVVRGNDRADTRFLCYAMQQADITAFLSGSTMPKLTQGNLLRVPVLTPPLSEQRAIAAVLGALDDKIELNRRMNETLEAMARAIFKDWFVDFGPTRAKMEGRVPYLAPDLWSLFPARLDDDGKPEGWDAYTLGKLATQHTASFSPSTAPADVFEHFSLPAYDAGQAPVRERGDSIKSNKTLLPQGAILLSKLNPEIERVWLAEAAAGVTQLCSTEFLVFTPNPRFSRSLLFGLFTEPSFRMMLQSMVTGTSKSHQRISPPALLSRQVIVGSDRLFACYREHVEPLLDRVVANRAECRTLAATRDILLPKLMSGEIRVKDAERFAQGAT
jgi:type I restriction enzyme S subunit